MVVGGVRGGGGKGRGKETRGVDKMVMSSALRRPGWGDLGEDSCPSIGRFGSVRSTALRAAPAKKCPPQHVNRVFSERDAPASRPLLRSSSPSSRLAL